MYDHQEPMRRAVLLALESKGYKVEAVMGGGGRLEVVKDGKRELVLVRTTAGRAIGWMRKSGKFKGLVEAGLVVAAALDNREHPKWIDIYALPPKDVEKAFADNLAARKAATPRLSDTAPIWVCLDELNRRSGWGVGSNLKTKALWHARLPYGEPSANMSDIPSAFSTATETRESFALRVRQEFADLIGVPIEKVTIDIRVTL